MQMRFIVESFSEMLREQDSNKGYGIYLNGPSASARLAHWLRWL